MERPADLRWFQPPGAGACNAPIPVATFVTGDPMSILNYKAVAFLLLASILVSACRRTQAPEKLVLEPTVPAGSSTSFSGAWVRLHAETRIDASNRNATAL